MEREEEKSSNPFGVFLWGGLAMAVLCFALAATRLLAHRPARADAYIIAGVLGLLGSAVASSLRRAHERSRRDSQSLRGALEHLTEKMVELPKVLAARDSTLIEMDRSERKTDQERMLLETRRILTEGLREGFAPMAPLLAQQIGASLATLSESMRLDREERSESLKEMARVLTALQSQQREWAQTSADLLVKLRDQGVELQKNLSSRDAGWSAALANLEKAAAGMSATATQVLEASSEAAKEQWHSVQAAVAVERREQNEAMQSQWKEVLQGTQKHFRESAEALTRGVADARGAVANMGQDAGAKLTQAADQAETWLRGLVSAGEKLERAFQGAQHFGEASATHQAELKGAVEMLREGLTGVLDRLQGFAALAQGQEALLLKMETAIRRFEERAADVLEDNALKAQEALLDVLQRIDVGSMGSGDPDLVRSSETVEPHVD